MNETEDYGPSPAAEPVADDPRLVAAVRDYQAALETGARPDRRDFLLRHSDIAGDLGECLDGLEMLHEAASGLRTPAGMVAKPPPLPSDGTLGDFHLIRELGRGGMGVVYEAVQISLGRRVALKVLPFAATLDARQLQRFENEARAAAHLHHGNIVPVFAVGVDRGVHYYAMQLIDGMTLATVIDHLRQTPKPAAPAADTVAGAASLTHQSVASRAFFRTVAAIGVQAADALEYAHQMGVVHRDIKPGNLLVDRRGNLWVTDFGLARVQSSPTVTAPGDLVGTLRYMSPEQAAGKPVIDPRGDVYSLGVTLYELLTQQPAFPATNKQECLRQILDDDPVPPHRLNKALPAELDTIVLKAMAKHPEDRYSSARELADDLRRFLDDQPVAARRPGWWDRAAKWARRHRRVVAAALLMLITAVVVLGGTTWRVARAEAQTRAALKDLEAKNGELDLALRQEEKQRDLADSNYRGARKVLDYLFQLGVVELGKREYANNREIQKFRRGLLSKLRDHFQDFIERYADDPTVADELLEKQLGLASILTEMGERQKAREVTAKACERFHHGQPVPFPAPFGSRGFARLFALKHPAVQRDLNLSAEQTAALAPYLSFQPGGGDKSVTDPDKVLAEVLTQAQSDRLTQIGRQLRGTHALLDAEAAETLALTEEQKNDIRAAIALWRPPPPRREQHDHAHPGFRPRPEWDGKPAQEAALQVLTADQRAQWEQLLGEPFRGDGRPGPRPYEPPLGRK
jgi:tRNA A-37 threonylcarbamoyl transferase component Bud32